MPSGKSPNGTIRPATDLLSCRACPFHAQSMEWAVGIVYRLAKVLSLPGARMGVCVKAVPSFAMSCMIQGKLLRQPTMHFGTLALWHLSYLHGRLPAG